MRSRAPLHVVGGPATVAEHLADQHVEDDHEVGYDVTVTDTRTNEQVLSITQLNAHDATDHFMVALKSSGQAASAALVRNLLLALLSSPTRDFTVYSHDGHCISITPTVGRPTLPR